MKMSSVRMGKGYRWPRKLAIIDVGIDLVLLRLLGNSLWPSDPLAALLGEVVLFEVRDVLGHGMVAQIIQFTGSQRR